MYKAVVKVLLAKGDDVGVSMESTERETYGEAADDCEIAKAIWEGHCISADVVEV